MTKKEGGGTLKGIRGNSSNLLYNPCGIDLDSNTLTLYIADNLNHRVMAYASAASSHTVVAGNNRIGINTTQLSTPFGKSLVENFEYLLTNSNSPISRVRLSSNYLLKPMFF